MLGLDVILPAAVGVVFIFTLIIITFVDPEPSEYQAIVYQTVLALAAAGFAAAIPGLLNVSVNLPGLTIRAAGAFASFVIVYRVNPATLYKVDPVPDRADPVPPSLQHNSLELIVDIYRAQNSQKNTQNRTPYKENKQPNYRSFDKENGNLKIIQPDNEYLDSIQNGGEVSHPASQTKGSLKDHFFWGYLNYPALDIKLVNNTSQTVFFHKLIFNIKKSRVDTRPIPVIDPFIGNDKSDMYIPLVNIGWGTMENCIVRFDIIPDDNSYDKFELPYYPFELNLGNIDPFKFSEDGLDNRKGYSIEECFKESGVDVELLKSLQDWSCLKEEYAYFPPESSIGHPFEQSNPITPGEKRLSMTEYESLLRGALGCFQSGEAVIFGEVNYVETNYEGHKFQRTNKFKHLVYLHIRTPLYEEVPMAPADPSSEYSIGFENQEENYNKVNYKFATHKDNYQVVLPEISHSLTPGEADRFLVYIEVEKSSIHYFDIILMYNNSEQLKSQDIKLELFRPVQWADQLMMY
jgi:hypothetical protein